MVGFHEVSDHSLPRTEASLSFIYVSAAFQKTLITDARLQRGNGRFHILDICIDLAQQITFFQLQLLRWFPHSCISYTKLIGKRSLLQRCQNYSFVDSPMQRALPVFLDLAKAVTNVTIDDRQEVSILRTSFIPAGGTSSTALLPSLFLSNFTYKPFTLIKRFYRPQSRK